MTVPTPILPGLEPRHTETSDDDIVRRVVEGDQELFAVLMRRHNRRVFRTVRGIVHDDDEAEDVAQEAWIAAYRGLPRFEGRAAFSTWLTRIAIRRAMARVGRRRKVTSLDDLDRLPDDEQAPGPERQAHRAEMARALERAIDRLPPSYRVVIMLRDVEHMSTREAADALGLREENLRVRLHRARGALRDQLTGDLGVATLDAIDFAGERCNRLVTAVLQAIEPSKP